MCKQKDSFEARLDFILIDHFCEEFMESLITSPITTLLLIVDNFKVDMWIVDSGYMDSG
jgi:hypothetical protein